MTGRRLVRRAILSIARKNGKTALIAALVLAHLIGPEAVQNGEIYSAANDREQAGQVFKMAAQIVRADPELGALLRIVDSTKTIACYGNGSFYRAVSAEAGTKHGLNPTFVIFDELAQARNRDLYDALDTSMGAREEPLFATISTQSNDPEHILSRLIDDGLSGQDPTIVCHLYAADEECDLADEAQWRKANPALGDFRSRDDLAALVAKSIRMPADEPMVRNLYLNQRVASTASLISRAEWMACLGEAEFVDGEEVYLGLDLSKVVDLTALVMVSAAEPIRVLPFAWKPADLVVEHSDRDFGRGTNRYGEWVAAGHLLTSPGRTVDREAVALFLAELSRRYVIRGVAYDRWKMDELLKAFDRIGLAAYQDGEKGDGLRLVPWGQGYRDMTPAIDALEQAVIDRKLAHPGNPLLTWNMANAVATTDPAGNRKLDKDKARFRIDGAVALTMAVGLRVRDRGLAPVNIDDFLAQPVHS